MRIALTRRGSMDVAALVTVLRPSPHRVIPGCRHFGTANSELPCGGCSWQHIAYGEQLRLKTALVERLIREAVPAAPSVSPMLPSTPEASPWGYRHKVHFVWGETEGRPSMGHYARASNRVVAVRECPVHAPRGNAVAFALQKGLTGSLRAAAHPSLVGLMVRVGAGSSEMSATLVVSDDRDKALRTAFRRLAERPDPPTALHVNFHPRRDRFIFGPETRRVSGPQRMREQVGGTSFLISPTAFFQTNIAAAEILVRLVLEAVPAGARVLDLYAGAGLFGISLARRGHDVVAIEENREAVADGEVSRRLNQIPDTQCRFIARPVERGLADLGGRRGAAPFDVVVLDPPRDGCTSAVLDTVFGRIRPATAIYVSCNPDALARDARAITALGYRITSLQPVDMFPHTAHIETVVTLVRTR